VVENAGLTEWPVPLLGRFDPAFLEVPREVIQLSMRTNQKYFALLDGDGKLAPNFICTANIAAADGGAAIAAGNGKVLAARLSDARFFWDQDLKVKLEDQAKKLDRIVFHEKLGTVADKVDRVAKLARWLAEQGIVPGADPQQAEDAARLAKADLVTGMVGEFPELQGVMGGYYARAEGYPDAVADAIRDHYKPVGQGDDVPTAPVTVAVSLADKLDTLAQFFFEGLPPTGSRDPFALRRAALGLIQTVSTSALSLPLIPATRFAMLLRVITRSDIKRDATALRSTLMFGVLSDVDDNTFSEAFDALNATETSATKKAFLEGFRRAWEASDELLAFFADRLKVQQREAGVRHDLIDAIFALGGEDDLVRLLARVKALQAFVATEDGANLLAGYRRAANIVRIERQKDEAAGASASLDASGAGYEPEQAEAALIAALDTAEPEAAAAVEREDFEGAMAALARLRPAVDAFFDQVTVNHIDPVKRTARLALLERIRVAMHNVADFSKIEG